MITICQKDDLSNDKSLNFEDIKMIEKIYNEGFGKLSREEQTTAFIRYNETKSKSIFDAIVVMNDGLVLKMTEKYKEMPDYDDILQEGRIALMAAVNKFDVRKNCLFSTYACHYIFGYVSRYMENNSFIHYPADVMREIQTYLKAAANTPAGMTKQIAESLNKSEERVNLLSEYANGINPSSLNAYVSEDSTEECISFLPDYSPTPEQIIEKKLLKEALYNELVKHTNSERQLLIVKKMFGIGENAKTTREIAEEFGLSHGGVSKSAGVLINKIRKHKNAFRKTFDIPAGLPDIDISNYLFQEGR